MNTKFKIIIGIFVVFFSGAAIGAIVSQMYFQNRLRSFVENGPPPMAPGLMRKFTKELGLTQKQRSEIEIIAKNLQSELFKFQQKHHPDIQKIIDKHIAQIKEKLSTEQKKKMDQLHEKFKRRMDLPPPLHKGHKKEMFMHGVLISRLKEELNLTQRQVKDLMDSLEKDDKEKFKPLQEHGPFPADDNSYPDHLKDEFPGRHDMEKFENRRDEMQQSLEKHLEKILTKEQMERYKNLVNKEKKDLHE